MRTRSLPLLLASLMLLMALPLTACSGSGRVGEGVGIGAIAGRGVGPTHSRMVVRAGDNAGKGIGYLINDEQDQAHAAQLARRTTSNNFSHEEIGPLTNTRWQVRSIVPAKAAGANLGMVVTFRPSGHVITRTTLPDSTTSLVNERYRVVGDTLILNKDGYLINAQFRIRGEVLTIAAGEFVAVLDRIRSRDGL